MSVRRFSVLDLWSSDDHPITRAERDGFLRDAFVGGSPFVGVFGKGARPPIAHASVRPHHRAASTGKEA